MEKSKGNNQQKHQFKSYYCAGCNQVKSCSILSKECCCFCYFKRERKRAKEHSSYEKVLVSKQRERKKHIRQLLLLKNYLGCKQCKSKEIDAYNWYEKNRLFCWACLVKKGRGSSNPISFTGESK